MSRTARPYPNIWARSYVTSRGLKRTLYYCEFRDWKGIRRTFPVGDIPDVAKQLRDQYLAQNSHKYDFDKAHEPATLFSVWADYWLALTAHKRSHDKDQRSVSRLKEFFGNALLNEIPPSRIEEYKMWRRGQMTKYGAAPKPATINRELACLRAALILAEQDHLSSRNGRQSASSAKTMNGNGQRRHRNIERF